MSKADVHVVNVESEDCIKKNIPNPTPKDIGQGLAVLGVSINERSITDGAQTND